MYDVGDKGGTKGHREQAGTRRRSPEQGLLGVVIEFLSMRMSRPTVNISGLCFVVLLMAAGCQEKETSLPAPAPRIDDELAAYLAAFPYERFQVVEIPRAGKFYVNDHSGKVMAHFRKGEPSSPDLIEAFREHVVPGTTAIDVGAHIGSLAVPLASLVGREGRVYAFEPQRAVYRELYHNLKLNGHDHAVPLLLAVSSEAGFLEMDPPFAVQETPDGPLIQELGFGRIGQGGERVEARTLDSFGFEDVSLIKIDVEGHEVDVLKGAKETILRNHPVLIIEMGNTNKKIIEPMLIKEGYRLEKLTDHWMDYIAVHDPGAVEKPGDAEAIPEPR
ncbi:MAG: FkbM family methyltransferase [Myxococcota bacterium]